MKSSDNVGITFANLVVGCGCLNGVVNITLGAFLFTPNEQGKIDADPAITGRLRLDEVCARNLYESLGKILAQIDDAKTKPGNGHAVDDTVQPGEKPN